MNKPKITIEVHPITETPENSFRRIFEDGQIGKERPPSAYYPDLEKAVGWIPAKAKVEEQIVPGWCEFEDVETKNYQVWWRGADDNIYYGKRRDIYPANQRSTWKFVRQLTHEPDEEPEQPAAPEPKEGEWWKVKHIATGDIAVRIYHSGGWHNERIGYGGDSEDWEPICKMEEVERITPRN